MKPEYEVRVDLASRILFTRMTGLMAEADMRGWCRDYREKGTHRFRGTRHIVIADMRGMKTVHPSIASLMGDEIGHARANGVALCAHISDDTVQRLQASRIARQNSPHDDVTIDVDSLEEAWRIARTYAKLLDDPRYAKSLRDAIK